MSSENKESSKNIVPILVLSFTLLSFWWIFWVQIPPGSTSNPPEVKPSATETLSIPVVNNQPNQKNEEREEKVKKLREALVVRNEQKKEADKKIPTKESRKANLKESEPVEEKVFLGDKVFNDATLGASDFKKDERIIGKAKVNQLPGDEFSRRKTLEELMLKKWYHQIDVVIPEFNFAKMSFEILNDNHKVSDFFSTCRIDSGYLSEESCQKVKSAVPSCAVKFELRPLNWRGPYNCKTGLFSIAMVNNFFSNSSGV